MNSVNLSPALGVGTRAPWRSRAREHDRALDTKAKDISDPELRGLLERIAAGNEEAFAELYQEFVGPIYAYLLTVLRNPHEAEDVTQEVFVRVHRFLGRFNSDRGEFRAWLFGIARNESRRRIGKGGHSLPSGSAELDELEAASPSALVDRDFLRLVSCLPAAQRDAIVLRYMFEFSNEEIATILGRSDDAVRQLQSRALRILTKRLGVTRQGSGSRQEYGMRRRYWGYRSTVVSRGRRTVLLGIG